MKKITQFTKFELQDLRQEFAKAVKGLEDSWGIKFALGGIRFSAREARGKLTILITDPAATSSKETPEEIKFKNQCHEWGLKPTDLHRHFRSGGTDYTLSGLRLTRSKYPFLATGPAGGRYRFPAHVILQALNEK